MPRRPFHIRNQARYRLIEAENARQEMAKMEARCATAPPSAVKQPDVGDQRDPLEMARAGAAALRAAV